MTPQPLTPDEARRVTTCPDCGFRWADHRITLDLLISPGVYCQRPDETLTQVAALVAEREAGAWDEGWQAGASRRVSTSNPYREATP